MVTAATRVNYGQSTKLNSLSGFITLVGGSNTRAVTEGLGTITRLNIENSGAKVRTETTVTKIKKLNKEFSVSFSTPSGEISEEKFDIVVIATPLDVSNIEIEGVELPKDYKNLDRKFQVYLKLLRNFQEFS